VVLGVGASRGRETRQGSLDALLDLVTLPQQRTAAR